MENKLLKFDDIKNTYIYFIRENLLVIKEKLEQRDVIPWDPSNPKPFFKARSSHLQVMSFIGLTAEHLIKLILSKRGFVINKIKTARVNPTGKFYEVIIDHQLIEFGKAVEQFKKSNPEDYYSGIQGYIMNPYPDIYDKYSYFGHKIIEPAGCIDLLVKVRNSYIHYANPQNEQNGIIWYLYNFLVWLVKKEFGEEFDDIVYMSSDESKKLWPHFENKQGF